MPYFLKQECYIIEDLEEIKESSPEEYQILHSQNISSLVASPLELDGRLIGYIGADNPPKEKVQRIFSLLSTLSYFLASSMLKQQNERRLLEMGYQDTLTRVHNRNRFIKDIEELNNHSFKQLGIMYIDLNGLKSINDEYGHAYGDYALTETVHKIELFFSREHIYRVGGDEFVVIVTPIAEEIFEKKVRDLKHAFTEEQEYCAAIGYQWTAHFQNIHQLISIADERMYDDKKEFYRKNPSTQRYRHNNDAFIEITDPRILKVQIKKGRFPIYFQPKISFQDRTPIGAEALIRYRDITGTIISPDRFIPLLENVHLISVIDFYVFESVCDYIEKWLSEGKKVLPASVNFSRYTLAKNDFLEMLMEIWGKYNFSQEFIEIEITEGAETDSSLEILNTLEKLKQKGFTVSIDDFGVKYANLFLFTSIDFDVLKIDKSLLNNIASNEKARTVIQAITQICKKLDITIIVEGVETELEFKILRGLNCDAAQGYLFSRPLPVEQYCEQYLKTEAQHI